MCMYLLLYFTICKATPSQKNILGKDYQINTFFFHLSVSSFFFLSKREKKKKKYKEPGEEKMEDFPINFFLLCTWILSVMSLETLRITTFSQNFPCKINNSWPFKRQLYFSSHFPLNSQVHIQTIATEELIQVACSHGVPAVHFSCF